MDDLLGFANQAKLDSPEGSPEYHSDGGAYGGDQGEYDGHGGMPAYEYVPSDEPPSDHVFPQPPFKTIEEERADIMYRLQRAQRNCIPVREFSWDSDIRDMRAEAERAKAEQEVDASVAFQRQILMTVCTGIEYANKRFDYLDL